MVHCQQHLRRLNTDQNEAVSLIFLYIALLLLLVFSFFSGRFKREWRDADES